MEFDGKLREFEKKAHEFPNCPPKLEYRKKEDFIVTISEPINMEISK